VAAAVAMMARPGDLVITLGAGSIGGTGERILEAIRHRRTQLATPADRPVDRPVNRREER
jgi:hypothetical protein